jgi:hypothetical protein
MLRNNMAANILKVSQELKYETNRGANSEENVVFLGGKFQQSVQVRSLRSSWYLQLSPGTAVNLVYL